MEKLFLCVLLCGCSVLLQCDSAHNLSCQPQPAEELTSSCVPSSSCLADHQPQLEKTQCQQQYSHVPVPHASSLNITQCPDTGGILRHCAATAHHNKAEKTYFLVSNLSSSVFSLDPEHFAINVSWYHRDRDHQLALAVSPPGQLVGYEVRLLRVEEDGSKTPAECWCVWETGVSSLLLGLSHSLSYQPTGNFEVNFLSLPHGTPESLYAPDPVTAHWPSGCNDLSLSHTLSMGSCPLPLYGKPHKISINPEVLSSENKELRVSWSHPVGSLVSLPSLYYIYGTSEEHNFTLLANGTRQVTISGLNPALEYNLQLQAYVECSGLSACISGSGGGAGCGGGGGGIGCGQLSDRVLEPLVFTTATSMGDTSSPQPTSTQETPAVTPAGSSELHVVLPAALGTLALLVVLFGAVVTLMLCRARKQPSSVITHLAEYVVQPAHPHIRALVLYPPSTPLHEQTAIERYVVCELKYDFRVVSCNDHTEKSIMEWLEQQTRQAHCVLLVCNQSFLSEWNSTEGSRFVNSLKTIIEYSVSNRTIDNFATVILEKSCKKFVPDYIYLKRMRCFVMGEGASNDDLNQVVKFVKCTRKTGLQFFSQSVSKPQQLGLGEADLPTPSLTPSLTPSPDPHTLLLH